MIIYRTAIRNDDKNWVSSYPLTRTNKLLVQLVNYDGDKYGWFRADHFSPSHNLDVEDFLQIDVTGRNRISISLPDCGFCSIGYEFKESDLQ